MRLLTPIGDHTETIGDWVALKTGSPSITPYSALGWIDAEGTLSIGFVFFNYVPSGNIEMGLAASGRLTRGVLRAVAHYVFEQVAAARITAHTRHRHIAACSMLRRAGFVQECICKRYFGDDDAVQFRMLKSEAERWLQ